MRKSVCVLLTLSLMLSCGTAMGLDYSIGSPVSQVYRFMSWGSGNKPKDVTVTLTVIKISTDAELGSASYASAYEGWSAYVYFNAMQPHGTPLKLQLWADGALQVEKVVTAVNYPTG